MRWRRAEKTDIPHVRRLWEQAGYGFDFPDLDDARIISSWIAEEDGKIICWSGAQLLPEIISIMDPSWGSPHSRMEVFESLHAPIARDIFFEQKYQRALCTPDPKYPKFSVRLLKARLGWFKWWPALWITKEAFGKK